MSYPIIVSPHKFGIKNDLDRVFFPIMLSCLIQSNPNAKIYLPNENPFNLNINGIEEISFDSERLGDIRELRKVYVHLSTNPLAFELACIERFFILRHISKQFQIENFFTVESDCLIFKDINLINNHLGIANSISLLTDLTCISTAYITSYFLEAFCVGVLNAYNTPSIVESMKSWYSEYIASGKKGGICDMSFCNAIRTGWLNFEKLDVVDISTIYEWNGNFHAYDNFFSRNRLGLKNSEIVMSESIFDSYPAKKYSIDSEGIFVMTVDQRKVYLNSMHGQGNNKKLMGLIYCQLTAMSYFARL